MLKYLVIASIFWFNPLISNIDIFPDLIGYLLIIKAFSKASYIYDFAEDVSASAKKMCIISGVKIFSIFIVSSFDPTMSLLMSFCFALVESIFGIPFFIKLFNAFSHLSSLKNDIVINNRVRSHTIVVFIARLILALLPDLTALSLNNAFQENADFTYLRFRPLFIGVSVIIAIVISVIWLVRYVKYVKCAIDKEATAKCEFDFKKQISNKKSIFIAKDNIKSIFLIGVGSLFIFDFTWGFTSVDIFQDFTFPVIAVLSFAYLAVKGSHKLNKAFFVLLGVLALQTGADIYEIKTNVRYFEKYNLASILKVSEAESFYYSVCISAVLSVITLVASCMIVMFVLRKQGRTCIVEYSDLFSQSDIDYYLKEYNNRTRKSITIVTITSIIYAIEYSVMVIIKPYAEWMIMVNNAIEILFIIFFISFLFYLYDEVYKRILTFS